MSDTVTLSNLDAMNIEDENCTHCGGDQEWYTERWQRRAGCGPTNCTNLFWYLGKTCKNCETLRPQGLSQKQDFVQLMNEVWHYVTPGNMGVNSTDIFVNGVKKYGEEKGIAFVVDALDVAALPGGVRAYHEVSDFIEKALRRNQPVAFLNLSNGTLDNLDSWHWVTIVSLRGDDALIYDQGKARWVHLRQWLETSLMGGGFVTVGVECPAETAQ